MKLFTFGEYAAHRKISPAAVTRAIQSGRIKVFVDHTGRRMIDVEAADRQWSENSDAGKSIGAEARRASALHARGEKDKQAAPSAEETETPPDTSSEIPPYQESRAKREAYLARLAKLEYEERTGKLVLAEKVRADAFRAARLAREAVLGIPDRLAAELASLTDPAKVHQVLSAELVRALEGLANEL